MQLEPALDESVAAIALLSPHDIRMLREVEQPPQLVRRVMDCVLILLHAKIVPIKMTTFKGQNYCQDSWAHATHLLRQADFKYKLLQYNPAGPAVFF